MVFVQLTTSRHTAVKVGHMSASGNTASINVSGPAASLVKAALIDSHSVFLPPATCDADQDFATAINESF